uniref:Uncharacterized protein n=1 Tax=Rhizophora mucronata TaxID=61149 RepID=A0A2P2PE14_RHIMU
MQHPLNMLPTILIFSGGHWPHELLVTMIVILMDSPACWALFA